MKGAIGERNCYEVSLFSSDVEDELIPFDLGGRDIYENAGKSSRDGLELSFASEPIDGLTVPVAYTNSNFKFDRFVAVTAATISVTGFQAFPKTRCVAKLRTRTRPIFTACLMCGMSADFLRITTIRSPSIPTSSSTCETGPPIGTLATGNWELEPLVGLNNLTDESYPAEIRINNFGGRYYEPAPDRHFCGGLSIRYNYSQGQQ